MYLVYSTCTNCGNTFGHSDEGETLVCPECQKEMDEEKKRKYLDVCAMLPTEERLRRIEDWMYEHKKAPHDFSGPPRIG